MTLYGYFSISNDLTSLSLIIFAVTIALYLIYRKKLDKKLPPGPLGLPIFGYLPCLSSKPHKMFFEMRKKYGDIIGFQFGRRYYVLLNEYTIAKETLNHPDALDRDPFYYSPIIFGFQSRNGAEWIQQRKFSMQALKHLGIGKLRFEEITHDYVNKCIKDIELFNGKPFPVTEHMYRLFINITASYLFGREFDLIKEEHILLFLIDYLKLLIEEIQVFSIDYIIPGYSAICEFLGIPGNRKKYKESMFVKLLRQETKRLHSFTNDENAENFLSLYGEKMKQIESQKKQSFFSEENLFGNASVLFLGATDTTFNSLYWLLMLMVKYQDVQKKVQRELDEVIGPKDSLNYEDRFKVPYTFSVILESQRISSIVPITPPKMAKEDFEIRGYTIPKDTIIIANLWGMHNDPNYWENPEKFRPERFMTNENERPENKPSYVPFSMGRRNCPGEIIALKMLFIFFVKLIQNFEVNFPPEKRVNFETDSGLIEILKSENLIFKKRIKKSEVNIEL